MAQLESVRIQRLSQELCGSLSWFHYHYSFCTLDRFSKLKLACSNPTSQPNTVNNGTFTIYVYFIGVMHISYIQFILSRDLQIDNKKLFNLSFFLMFSFHLSFLNSCSCVSFKSSPFGHQWIQSLCLYHQSACSLYQFVRLDGLGGLLLQLGSEVGCCVSV